METAFLREKGSSFMAFAHLHTHTEYSLLDGSNKIKEYVARVKELGMNSAAITDHGVMYGVVEFYKTAKVQALIRSSDVRSMWLQIPVLTGRPAMERTDITI